MYNKITYHNSFNESVEITSYLSVYRLIDFLQMSGEGFEEFTTKAYGQHGDTWHTSLMQPMDFTLNFLIRLEGLDKGSVMMERRKMARIFSPLRSPSKLEIELVDGNTYWLDVVASKTPYFPQDFKNRNDVWQVVQVELTAHHPLFYQEGEMIQGTVAEPIFNFPSEYSEATVSGYRYVRHTMISNDSSTTQAMYEIQLYDTDGTNLLLGKLPMETITPLGGTLDLLTDGNTGSPHVSVDDAQVSLTYDLGSVVTNLDVYKVWHFIGRSQVYKVEFSEDNVTWYTHWDSNVDGTYVETADGFTINAKPESIPLVEFGMIHSERTINNEGDFEAPLTIQLISAGLCKNPVIKNITTGEQIVFKNLTMQEGQILLIDTTFGRKTVTLDGSNVFNTLDYNLTTFFSLDLGINELDVSYQEGKATALFKYKKLYAGI